MADTSERFMFLEKLKVAELRKELADRGLAIKGNKSELISRLEDHLEKEGIDIQEASFHKTVDENEQENDIADEVKLDVTPSARFEDGKLKKETIEKEELLDTEQQVSKGNLEETSNSDHEEVSVTQKSVLTKSVSNNEKKLERIKRFGGVINETDKKLQRAQRFGSGSVDNIIAAKPSSKISHVDQSLDIDKLRKRAERFGVVSPAMSKIEESDRLKKRKERFGVPTTTLVTQDLDVKKQKRAERFGL